MGLIEKKCDINKPVSDKNFSSLYLASEYNRHNIVELLLDNKANLNQTDSKNRTSLFIASCNGNSEIVKLLINNGANVTIMPIQG